MHIPLSYIQFY